MKTTNPSPRAKALPFLEKRNILVRLHRFRVKKIVKGYGIGSKFISDDMREDWIGELSRPLILCVAAWLRKPTRHVPLRVEIEHRIHSCLHRIVEKTFRIERPLFSIDDISTDGTEKVIEKEGGFCLDPHLEQQETTRENEKREDDVRFALPKGASEEDIQKASDKAKKKDAKLKLRPPPRAKSLNPGPHLMMINREFAEAVREVQDVIMLRFAGLQCYQEGENLALTAKNKAPLLEVARRNWTDHRLRLAQLRLALTQKQFDAVLLRHGLEGVTKAQVGQVLGCRQPVVDKTLKAAYAKIKQADAKKVA